MSSHIRMLNPMSARGHIDGLQYEPVCDCAGPGGCTHYIDVPCKIHLVPRP